jgi:uncharacterized protein YceK
MRASRTITALLLLAPLFVGCGSIGGRHDSGFYPGLYPGVRYDCYYLSHPHENTDMQPLWWMGSLDLPPSAVLDTLLLPYDFVTRPIAVNYSETNPSR